MNDSRKVLAWAGFGVAAGGVILLLQSHLDHARAWFPFLLILACPLMHVFMHRGHGQGHAHQDHRGDDRTA